jgi:hypothetical protein
LFSNHTALFQHSPASDLLSILSKFHHHKSYASNVALLPQFAIEKLFFFFFFFFFFLNAAFDMATLYLILRVHDT